MPPLRVGSECTFSPDGKRVVTALLRTSKVVREAEVIHNTSLNVLDLATPIRYNFGTIKQRESRWLSV
jgi:hypothetical protein